MLTALPAPPISVRAMNTTVQKADDVGLEWPRPDEIPGCVRIFGFESNIPSSDARQHFDWEVVAEGKSAWIHVDDQSQVSKRSRDRRSREG
jgi:hypothetical protein